jgi:hypothetical protein
MEYWGLIIFSVGLASSSILSISSITNAMSGHDNIMLDMTPHFTVFPFILAIFCISFFYALRGLAENPFLRKMAVFMFVSLAYLFSMFTLHLSTHIVTSSL